MRSHNKNQNNRRQRGNKVRDDDRYIDPRQDEGRTDIYSRPHQGSEDYRLASTSSRGSFGMERDASSSHSQREVDAWRRPDPSYDSYNSYDGHRVGRDDYDVGTRDDDPWYPREGLMHDDWSRHYDQGYNTPSYAESAWAPTANPYGARDASHDPWAVEEENRQRFGEDRRHNANHDERRTDQDGQGWRRDNRREKAPVRFQSDSGWDTRRRTKAWDTQPHQEPPLDEGLPPPPPLEDRSWEPGPSWKASNQTELPGQASVQGQGQGRRNSKNQRNQGGNKNKNSRKTQNSNRQKRDWRQDDGQNPNNWTKRTSVQPEKSQKNTPRRKHPRSLSQSPSRTPDSYGSRHSSRGRSRSRSFSPVPKRARRDTSPAYTRSRTPSDRGRPGWTTPRRDYSPPHDRDHMTWPARDSVATPDSSRAKHRVHDTPPSGSRKRSRTPRDEKFSRSPSPTSPRSLGQRRRSISTASSLSTDRSVSRSPSDKPRAVHRLPPSNVASTSSPVSKTRNRQNARGGRNGNHQFNGKHNEGKRKGKGWSKSNANNTNNTNSESMAPPPDIPPSTRTAQHHRGSSGSNHSMSDSKLDFPVPPPRIMPATTKPGFKPIGQTSSLKKFFPGDDEDMDLSQSSDIEPTPAPISTQPITSNIGQVLDDKEVPCIPSTSQDTRTELVQQPSLPNFALPQPPSALHSVNTSPRNAEPDGLVPSTPSQSSSKELYQIVSQVGEGTFGKVYKAQNTISRLYVALKRIRMEAERDGFPVTAMREIKLLQSLRHDNVVRLHEMMVSNGSVYMVFEYMDHDLTGILSQTQFTFSDAHLKSLCKQMLAGLAYLHRKGVIHRDIKGSNILVNNRGELKLADFGLARFYQKRRSADYTNRVITLWYRPPELLFGATVYGPEVDMWSAGCIMLELFTKKPVFQGMDEINQLSAIYKLLGTPTPERWAGVLDLPWYELIKPQQTSHSRLREYFQKWMSPAALDLAEGLLCYNPVERVSAVQAMQAPYFTQELPAEEIPDGLATLEGEWHELETKREREKKKRKAEGAAP